MEIRDIKQRLSILAVLEHYHLKPDKHQMLKCPFHEDDQPSLKIYTETNTFNCFGCNANGDAIPRWCGFAIRTLFCKNKKIFCGNIKKARHVRAFLFYRTNCFNFFLVINASRKTLTTFLSASGSFSMLLNWFRSSLSAKELSARSSEVPFVK